MADRVIIVAFVIEFMIVGITRVISVLNEPPLRHPPVDLVVETTCSDQVRAYIIITTQYFWCCDPEENCL